MFVFDVFKGVFKFFFMYDGFVCGFCEVFKVFDCCQVYMCVFNEFCEEEVYKKFVIVFCFEYKIFLIKVFDGK